MSSTQQLIRNNQAYAKRHRPLPDANPVTGVAVVFCMDHRINIFDIIGVSTGDIDRICNAGGVVTPEVLQSLAISQRRKGTTEVMVIGHVPCGMQELNETALFEEIYRESGERPSFPIHAFPDTAARVAESVLAVRNCMWLPHRDAVSGWVFDMASGALTEVAVLDARDDGTA